MMTLMFAANRTTTDSTSTSTSLQKLLRWSFSIRVSLFVGIGITNVNINSMFVVIDTSKCPTRQDRAMPLLWPTHLAATLLPLSKHTNGHIVQTA